MVEPQISNLMTGFRLPSPARSFELAAFPKEQPFKESASVRRPPSVTVRAYDFALIDLVHETLEVAIAPETGTDIELLGPSYMIELEYYGIVLTAINTWMLRKISDQPFGTQAMNPLRSSFGVAHVPLFVG